MESLSRGWWRRIALCWWGRRGPFYLFWRLLIGLFTSWLLFRWREIGFWFFFHFRWWLDRRRKLFARFFLHFWL
jgi:hypothetical protein